MSRTLLFAATLTLAAAPTSASADSVGDATRQAMSELMTLYRHLHANPELSFVGVKTGTVTAAALDVLKR